MRWIYLSPHLDDAILSAGGLIYEQIESGNEVEIWTLFCGFPHDEKVSQIAEKLHSFWGFQSAKEAVCIRREEDLRAAKIVGAHVVHLDFLDSIYRRNHKGDWLYDNTFAPPHDDDSGLSARITASLTDRFMKNDNVVCPLAIGGHVDHVIIRNAVEACILKNGESLDVQLWYYADIPYLLEHPSALDLIEKSMQAESRNVARKGLAIWKKSIAEYASQIPLEFESLRKMRKAISKYGRKGVRLWRVPYRSKII